jgi:Ca2+-binding EF-hand superfamily protein
VLNAIDTFEPYASYLRLTKGRGTPITATDINDFMKSNGFEGDYMSISLIVRLFDTRFEGSLDFEDYLKMTLSRDNPEIRFSAAQRDNYEVEQGDLLAPEIEYTLARFFFKASEFLSKIMQDPETHLILTQTNLFREIDSKNSRHLDFHNLKAFFEESKIKPRDSEIIAILRIIDINDDGKINENEFNFFIELFSGKEPGTHTLNVLKRAHEEDNKVNYFGEKSNQDPYKYDREVIGYQSRIPQGQTATSGIHRSSISPSYTRNFFSFFF